MGDRPCPKCGAATKWEPECPRYPKDPQDLGKGYMCCFPACGNADRYECIGEDCDWFYADGMREGYNGWGSNRFERPSWLPAADTADGSGS